MIAVVALVAATLANPRVETLAGNGRAGIVDGRGARAEFMGPQGIAYDARGDLYVADAPAQRIREIDPHGVVRTIAGSGAPLLFGTAVAGGYRNGLLASARFDDPVAVALGGHGTIYVADAGNRCIRVIRGGVVRTLSGAPSRRGRADGPPQRASFTDPRSLAYDARQHVLYVADVGVGIRRVAADGSVTTLAVPQFAKALAVAMGTGPSGDELLVGTPRAIFGYDLERATISWSLGTEMRRTPQAMRTAAGGVTLGPPSALAALGPRAFVYTDDLFSTVRLVQGTVVRRIGAPPLLNASPVGGGFRDGANRVARFAQPMGVAVGPSGEIAIADTANKRIRIVRPFDTRTALARAPLATPVRIALVGSLVGRWSGAYLPSVAGRLAERLCAGRALGCRIGVDAYPRGANPRGYAAVVAIASGTHPLSWVEPLARAYGRGFAVALVPSAAQLPDAALAWKLAAGGGVAPQRTAQEYRGARSFLAARGIATFDLWPAFASADRDRPFYGALVPQLTDAGCAWLGDALADRLRAARLVVP